MRSQPAWRKPSSTSRRCVSWRRTSGICALCLNSRALRKSSLTGCGVSASPATCLRCGKELPRSEANRSSSFVPRSIEAQLAETYLLASIGYQSMVAAKATRITRAPEAERSSNSAHGEPTLRRRGPGGACRLHRWLGNQQHAGRASVRHSCLRHGGTFLGARLS